MKQAVMTAPGKIEIRDTAPPEPGPGEVLLRVQRIGICGSDVHVLHGRHPYTSYPVIQGHEYSAAIESLGPGVSGLRIGAKVTSLPQIVCGTCAPCRRGDEHICDSLKVQGFQAPGCAQELWTTAASKVVELPDSFTFDEGAMVEPLSVAIHAVSRAGKLDGRNVAVVGGGPIGNLVAQVAKSEGARVLLTDLSPLRLDLANRCGIDLTSNAGTEKLTRRVAPRLRARGVRLGVRVCRGRAHHHRRDREHPERRNAHRGGGVRRTAPGRPRSGPGSGAQPSWHPDVPAPGLPSGGRAHRHAEGHLAPLMSAHLPFKSIPAPMTSSTRRATRR